MGDSVVKEKLKSLCCNNGWSYGIFWRLDQRNPMSLTLEDAYYEEKIGELINSLRLQVHMPGEGIISQVAITGKHQWMFSDAWKREWNSNKSIQIQDGFQDSEFSYQFSRGIKTIALISVEKQGVVHFGSLQKIQEKLDFVDQTRILFQKLENDNRLIPLHASASSTENETEDISRLLASLISSGSHASGNVFPSVSEIHHGRKNSAFGGSSHGTDQLQTNSFEPAAVTACTDSWSCDGSVLTSFEPQYESEMTFLDAYMPSGSTTQEFHGDSAFTSFDFSGEFLGDSFNNLTTLQHLTSLSPASEAEISERCTGLPIFPEVIEPTDFTEDLSKFDSLGDLSQWFTPSVLRSSGEAVDLLNDFPLQSMGSASCGLVKGDVHIDIPVMHPTNYARSCITNTLNYDMQEKSQDFTDFEAAIFDGLRMDLVHRNSDNFWEGLEMPTSSSAHSSVTSAKSGCNSQLSGSVAGPRKGLFSELGIGELLDSIANSNSVPKSGLDNQLSTAKRRKTESLLGNCDGVQLGALASATRNISSIYVEKTSTSSPQNEVLPRSKVGLWGDDKYSIRAGSAVLAQTKRPDQPTKITKKRARPGESTRPRPKDRQMMQDCIKQLRGIIPNGDKYSIDSLLDRTIKYMLFLQSVTKHADKLLQTHEPRLIKQESGVIFKDGSTDSGSRGATWAFEVGDQTMVCPIIVEDLGPPGQMLIEMLCEDRGFFLEIADEIRGFGLDILKGVMEMRENKIWAHFVVEANRHVTRMEIFWSLVQLLHDTATSGIDSTTLPNNIAEEHISPLKNFQQPMVPIPVSIAETL